MFVSVDPGERVGVATFNDKGENIYRTTFSIKEFRKLYLKQILRERLGAPKTDPKLVFIVEDFSLRRDKSFEQTGSDMPASRCIGAVELAVDILGHDRGEIVFQSPGNLKTALKWAGFPDLANKPRSWHCPDDLSAYAHGVFYLIQNNYRKHPIFND